MNVTVMTCIPRSETCWLTWLSIPRVPSERLRYAANSSRTQGAAGTGGSRGSGFRPRGSARCCAGENKLLWSDLRRLVLWPLWNLFPAWIKSDPVAFCWDSYGRWFTIRGRGSAAKRLKYFKKRLKEWRRMLFTSPQEIVFSLAFLSVCYLAV